MNAKRRLLMLFALGVSFLSQVAAAPAGRRYCERYPDPRCQTLTATPQIRETEEFPPIESTPTATSSATPIPSETPETPAPTKELSATPTASATPGQDPATPTPSSTPTSTETATEIPTLIASPSSTPTGTEVIPTPTDEV